MMRWRVLVLALALPSSAETQVRAGPVPASVVVPGVTAFVNVAVVPMDVERVLWQHTVVVQNGRITALGPVHRIQVPTGAVLVDGTGKFLIPGLADMHSHGESGNMLRLVAQGITTVRSMEGEGDKDETELLHLRARVAAGEVLGPRIYVPGGLYDGGKPLSPAAAAAQVVAHKAAGYDHIKLRMDYGEALAGTESPVLFDSIVAAARRVGIPVIGHIPKGVTFEQALASMKDIEHLSGLFTPQKPLTGEPWPGYISEHTWPLTEAKLRKNVAAVKRAGVWICPTRALYELSQNLQGTDGPRIIRALQDAGVGLLAGTDLEDIHEELESLNRAGLTPYQALVTATRNPAAYFGTLHETGTIAVGKRADLVLLKGNPLASIRYVANPAGVVLNGLWLTPDDIRRRQKQAREAERQRGRDRQEPALP